MREPKRKPGKYSNLKPDPEITKEKHDALVKELERIHKIRPSLISEVQRLAALGDFSENAAYQIAKGKLRRINWRILEIEDHLRTAVIIEAPQNSDKVVIGSTVTFKMGSFEKTFKILGSSETNPDENIISYNSPIGAALMGRKKGEIKTVYIAGKDQEIKILDIK